jgi:phospholipase/carboxylesterase
VNALTFQERPATGDPAGLLVLHHGRGADDHDLLGLGEMLDPGRQWHVVTPRAPLDIGGGYHWYLVPRVGYPDPETFHAAFGTLAAFHDELWERTGIAPEDTVFGRPKPAGILAFSGFIPTVEGWQPDLASRADLPVFIAHGRRDPIMAVDFARRARELLEAGGLPVEYHESDAGHEIDPGHLRAATEWLAGIPTTARKGP